MLWIFVALCHSASANAEVSPEMAKQAQNPNASPISVPFQNDATFGVGEEPRVQDSLLIEPVIPFELTSDGNLTTRTVGPLIDQPTLAPGLGRVSGLGDVQVLSPAPILAPTTVFVQGGFGDQQTTAYTAGLTWDLPWHHDFKVGRLGTYAEVAIGRWHTDTHPETTAWPTQISFTPTLRLYPVRAARWFVEAGVGANYIVPLFKSGEKRFSTEFNFGDHVAIGREFGHSEVSIRMEHFSNAGIKHPNPGENFGQMRYAYRF